MNRNAFTLVELLVTLTILVILAGLSMVVINKALEKGYKVKCSSNLRQIGIAFQAYWQENNNFLPQRVYSVDSATGGQLGYDELLLDYTGGDTNIFQCPSHSPTDYPAEPSYGMNWYFDNMNISRARDSSKTILATESAGDSGTGSHRADRDSGSPGQLDDQRHNGKAHYLFFDGHVEFLTWEETLAPTDMWGTDDGQHTYPPP